MVHRSFANLNSNPTRDLLVDLGHAAVRVGHHRRLAGIGVGTDAAIQRQRTEEFHAVVLAHALAAAFAEDALFVATLRADVQAHVLDHPDDGDADLLEHLETLARVNQRDVLRRGDDHRARHRHALCQRQLDVAGAGRQVDHQVVEVVPVGIVQQLLQRLGDHRATPDHGRFDVDQEADRHRLDAVADQRLEVLAVVGLGLVGDAQHGRLRRAVDISVQHADTRAFGGQRQRQVDGGGGLADAALAGGHGDFVLDVVYQLDAALDAVGHDLEADVGGGARGAGGGGGRGGGRL